MEKSEKGGSKRELSQEEMAASEDDILIEVGQIIMQNSAPTKLFYISSVPEKAAFALEKGISKESEDFISNQWFKFCLEELVNRHNVLITAMLEQQKVIEDLKLLIQKVAKKKKKKKSTRIKKVRSASPTKFSPSDFLENDWRIQQIEDAMQQEGFLETAEMHGMVSQDVLSSMSRDQSSDPNMNSPPPPPSGIVAVENFDGLGPIAVYEAHQARMQQEKENQQKQQLKQIRYTNQLGEVEKRFDGSVGGLLSKNEWDEWEDLKKTLLIWCQEYNKLPIAVQRGKFYTHELKSLYPDQQISDGMLEKAKRLIFLMEKFKKKVKSGEG